MPDPSRLHWFIALRPDWPLLLLGFAALIAPFVVLDQGGGWHTALFSAPATLAVPALAVEAMLALARLGDWMEGHGSR